MAALKRQQQQYFIITCPYIPLAPSREPACPSHSSSKSSSRIPSTTRPCTGSSSYLDHLPNLHLRDVLILCHPRALSLPDSPPFLLFSLTAACAFHPWLVPYTSTNAASSHLGTSSVHQLLQSTSQLHDQPRPSPPSRSAATLRLYLAPYSSLTKLPPTTEPWPPPARSPPTSTATS